MKRKKKLKMSLAQVDMEGKFPPAFSIVEENVLAASGIPDAESMPVQMQNLRQNKGVRGVLSLTEDSLPRAILEAKDIQYLHLPTIDLTPSTLAQLSEGVQFINNVHAETGGATLVHCREGVGRTGTMLAAWYITTKGMDAKTAIEHIRSLRTGSIHKKHQELRLYQLQKVWETPELKAKLLDGTLDESVYDFGGLKANAAYLMGRTTEKFLLYFYYARWLAHVSDVRGWDGRLKACFIREVRSPTWKPRIKQLFSPDAQRATSPVSDPTSDADAPLSEGDDSLSPNKSTACSPGGEDTAMNFPTQAMVDPSPKSEKAAPSPGASPQAQEEGQFQLGGRGGRGGRGGGRRGKRGDDAGSPQASPTASDSPTPPAPTEPAPPAQPAAPAEGSADAPPPPAEAAAPSAEAPQAPPPAAEAPPPAAEAPPPAAEAPPPAAEAPPPAAEAPAPAAGEPPAPEAAPAGAGDPAPPAADCPPRAAPACSRSADISYLQDQGVPQLMLGAIRELLSERPESPRLFFARYFSRRSTEPDA